MTSEGDPALMNELTRRNIPTVFMDTGKPGTHCANIRIDYAQGIREAVEHLYALNHRRIAFISGPTNLESARLRRDAFITGVKVRGIFDSALIEKGDHRIEGGALAMRSLLAAKDPPTAVVSSNDLTAIGALGEIHRAGLKVPSDISLIGFDDISFAHLTQPPLTTVILSRTKLAIMAFAALEGLLRKENRSHADLIIPTHLIVRESTQAINGA
jgi:LacI family transcriptional regulator